MTSSHSRPGSLVGRWPSGAPLVRAPQADDPALGTDAFAANDFAYVNAHPPGPLRPEAQHPPDTFAPALADPAGAICPHGAHVRKVNPRDQGTDVGGPRATLRHLLLRRGMPFGDPFQQDAAAADGSPHTITTDTEWVVPTGGGYFFAPSISAVRDALTAPDS